MTAEELLKNAETFEYSNIIEIDGESRAINIPLGEEFFGVEGDMKVERKYFSCPKVVGDNVDLSECNIYINYVLADKEGNPKSEDVESVESYFCNDLSDDGDNIKFTWLLSGRVLAEDGYIAFAVVAKKSVDGILENKWNTTPGIGIVKKTIKDGIEIQQTYPDVIDNLMNRVHELETIIESGGAGGGSVTSVNGQTGAVNIPIPSKTSDLENDKGFITRLVADLENYYLKSETYTKDEVKALVSSIPKFSIKPVESLPTTDISTTTVYLLKSGDETNNLYTEYIYVNGAWEYLGTQTVDLTGYATEAYVKDYAQPKGNYATTAQLNQVSKEKVDQTQLTNAVNTALAEAKESGQFDGADGKDGKDGKDGSDGYTPQKGVDYFDGANGKDGKDGSDYVLTEADKEEIAEKVPYVKVAEEPTFVDSIAEMTDTSKMYVLKSDGMFYSYKTKEITTEGSKTPNFTNVMESSGAYVKAQNRYSHSSSAFKACTTDDAIIIPITSGSHTIRVRGANNEGAYKDSHYYGDNNQTFLYTSSSPTRTIESNGDIKIVATIPSGSTYMVFHVKAGVDANSLIVTVDQEITYTTVEGETEVTYEWSSTGISYNQPADYEPRVIAVESKTKTLESQTKVLSDRLDNLSIDSSSSESIVFSLPAFAPIPQKAPTADGGGIMDVRAIRTNTYYEYMDELVSKHPNYLYKQYMSKDETGTYDHNRYIACRAYYHAWQKENYPMMFAWINGNVVVYSLSVSPRVGDVMYSTPYIGTSYGTVSVVNCNFDPVKASTRTVNGLEFERYSEGDIEPTVVYTTVKREYADCTVYNSSFATYTTVSSITDDVMTCADGIKYTRYPFEDRRNDKSKPLSIFILSNEHAGCNWGDSSIVSIIVAQFLTDMCKNVNIPFLRWIKDNCMITTIPIGNPWGYSEDSIDGYNNSNGVNINRNYDTPGWCLGEYDLGGGHGEYAGSEVETQNIMNTVNLCKAHVCLSMHGVGHHNETPTQGGYAQMQGQGFDHSIRRRLEEILSTSYNLGLEADITDYNDPYHTGKSPSYFQWYGAVGGLTETVPWNALTGEYFDSVSMEAGYTEMLLFLQCWIKEALEKMS